MTFASVEDLVKYYFPNIGKKTEKTLSEIEAEILEKFGKDIKAILAKNAVFKSCPRCGSEKIEVIDTTFGDSMDYSYRCICSNGHAYDEWLDTEQEAIDAWNERPKC